jgi:hypothetical protein
MTDLICWPTRRGGATMPGAVQRLCRTCGQLVWVAPSGLILVHGGARLLCIDCLMDLEVRQGRAVRVDAELAPGAVAEIWAAIDAASRRPGTRERRN